MSCHDCRGKNLELFRNGQESSSMDVVSQGTFCQWSEMEKRETQKSSEVIFRVRKWLAKYDAKLFIWWGVSCARVNLNLCAFLCSRGVLALKVTGLMNQRKGSCEVIQKPLEFKYPQSLLCAIVRGDYKPTGSPTYCIQSGELQKPLCYETVDKSIESEQR